MALTISSLIVVMVSTVFLVQNQYYAIQLSRTTAQDNARMMTEMMSSELRSVMQGGVVTAQNDSVVVRSPIVLAAICYAGAHHDPSVQYVGGADDIDTDEVSGVAMRDPTDGSWSYHDADFSKFNQTGGTPAVDCYNNGADTVGAKSDFAQMKRLNTYFGGDPPAGSILMIYRKVSYFIATSTMDSDDLALYRAISGGNAVELVTGLDSSAQFQYRTGGSSYATSVSSGNVSKIDAIRIVAEARTRPQTGGVDDVTYGWSTNVILRNGN